MGSTVAGIKPARWSATDQRYAVPKSFSIVGSDVSELRIGIVGLAGIGQGHLYACGLAGSKLTAVCDVDAEVLKKAVAAHPVEAFGSAEELFASGACDAVVVATPPFLHAEHVRGALDSGLHVYCEKPLAPTARSCIELADAAAAARRVLAVGFQHRFQKSHVLARSLIASGSLGAIHRVSLTGTNWFRPQHYFDSSPWRARWRTAGGGTLISQAVHQIDALVSFTGLPARVYARAYRALHPVEVEDDAMALLEYASGARGTLVASTVDPAGVDRIEVHGDRGSLVMDGFRLRRATFPDAVSAISAQSTDAFGPVDVTWEEIQAPGDQSEWFNLVVDSHRDFAAAIAGATSPTNHAREATKSVELINAIYLSSVTGRPVDLPLNLDAYDEVYADLCAGRASLPVRPGPL
jgi:predicted dehydrogenase